MGFVKLSLTALLVATFFSLASTVNTTKVSAQELKLDLSVKKTSSAACPMTPFLVMAENCTKAKAKKEKVSQILPSEDILPKVKLEEPKKEEIAYTAPIIQSEAQLPPTATLSAEHLFSLVNAHRAGISLPPFEHEAQICAVAELRREELPGEINRGIPMHAGFYAKNLPYYATENMIYMRSEEEALNWWLNSPIHRSAINGSYKYACGVCNGQVCNMVFTNYDPKNFVQNSATTAITPTPTLEKKPEAMRNIKSNFELNSLTLNSTYVKKQTTF